VARQIYICQKKKKRLWKPIQSTSKSSRTEKEKKKNGLIKFRDNFGQRTIPSGRSPKNHLGH